MKMSQNFRVILIFIIRVFLKVIIDFIMHPDHLNKYLFENLSKRSRNGRCQQFAFRVFKNSKQSCHT